MDKNTLELDARIQTLQTLVTILFAQHALQTANPIAAVSLMRDQAHRIMQKLWSTSVTDEDLAVYKEYTAKIVTNIFE